MMGTKARIFTPIVVVSLDELVPANHFYRHLDRVVDLSFVRDLVKETYAHGGRPSIDPAVFFKLQLVMFFEDIRSERLLMQLVADKLSVRWYIGYNLDEPLPDHSSLTRIRQRYGLEIFRRFFDAIVEQGRQAKLIWGKEIYFDATKVEANASLDSLKPRFAVEAHLANLFAPESQTAEETDQAASQEEGGEVEPVEQKEPPVPAQLPTSLSQEEYEALSQHNAERHDWIATQGQQHREVTSKGYQRMADLRISTTDPDATVMPLKGAGSHLGYHLHYVVDGGKARIILEVLVTPSEVMENQPMLDLLWRTRFRWKLWPRQVTGDTTYGTVENIVALEREQIRAYVPLPHYDQRTPYYGKQLFHYDAERDCYICPQGATLRPVGVSVTEQTIRYKAPPHVCRACQVRSHCTTNPSGRIITRLMDEEFVERVRGYQQTEVYQKALRKRSVWVEPLFAEGKQWHGMRRFRLRRLWRVNCEALMRAAGQNLKRLLKKRGWGRRPCPAEAMYAFFLMLCGWVGWSFFEDIPVFVD